MTELHLDNLDTGMYNYRSENLNFLHLKKENLHKLKSSTVTVFTFSDFAFIHLKSKKPNTITIRSIKNAKIQGSIVEWRGISLTQDCALEELKIETCFLS